MLDADDATTDVPPAAPSPGDTMRPVKRPRRRAASRPAGPPETSPDPKQPSSDPAARADAEPPVKATRKRAAKKTAPAAVEPTEPVTESGTGEESPSTPAKRRRGRAAAAAAPVFQAPDLLQGPADLELKTDEASGEVDAAVDHDEDDDGAGEGGRRRRRRGGRGRRGRGGKADPSTDDAGGAEAAGAADADGGAPGEGDKGLEITSGSDADGGEPDGEGGSSSRRRRRRRRGGAGDSEASPDDPPNTVVRVRNGRSRTSDEVAGVKGSTRLEAKKQRRREGREQGRRRQPILTESEFLARRESVERVMVVRQTGDRTQIGMLEDGVLVEHYVNKADAASFVGNVYLGRVQNVLPSMEAAFVDIGKGRNAVLYAGEVNWDAAGLDGQPRRIEHALKSGDQVLVQVTKDPIGHKGARLTAQVSLPGRFLVYVPDGSMTGISRKLPDTERTRLKNVLKTAVPDGAGVIVRTAAEGASEEELSRDVARLIAQWEDIEKKSKSATAPRLLYSEPDLSVRVLRDVFNEDVASVIVSGDDAWDMIQPYVAHVAPDLLDRVSRWTDDQDVFAAHRIDEQLAKALDRKVWLPSGGSLVIDRTEAMTVIDVNTGKFTGSGGNLEETVTRNNLEAAEEIVRQLRLRDVGGIIVVDFIDMVLESNRDLVLRRLLECLARDRTKHQVAEVTSLGLVQMTRKRVGQGLLEAFSVPCGHCGGRGVLVQADPVEIATKGADAGDADRSGRRRRSDKADRADAAASAKAAKASKAIKAIKAATEVAPTGAAGEVTPDAEVVQDAEPASTG